MAMAFDLGRTKCVCVCTYTETGGKGRPGSGASPASVCKADHYFVLSQPIPPQFLLLAFACHWKKGDRDGIAAILNDILLLLPTTLLLIVG